LKTNEELNKMNVTELRNYIKVLVAHTKETKLILKQKISVTPTMSLRLADKYIYANYRQNGKFVNKYIGVVAKIQTFNIISKLDKQQPGLLDQYKILCEKARQQRQE
jgi:hypothetical protein